MERGRGEVGLTFEQGYSPVEEHPVLKLGSADGKVTMCLFVGDPSERPANRVDDIVIVARHSVPGNGDFKKHNHQDGDNSEGYVLSEWRSVRLQVLYSFTEP